ncbi:hypothetical protein HNQ93_003269 [Hymenobacter luteus]|uniref:Uncharacterized protein n=2 Tax=Hymenobacter TaxID=89966 RepID=A0A7W9T3I2_9BACT|nr:hypothetical protein [Hymenobacter latericoloratus]MBB6060403.1 hypothetical protein [Hymenobacter luteus]
MWLLLGPGRSTPSQQQRANQPKKSTLHIKFVKA